MAKPRQADVSLERLCVAALKLIGATYGLVHGMKCSDGRPSAHFEGRLVRFTSALRNYLAPEHEATLAIINQANLVAAPVSEGGRWSPSFVAMTGTIGRELQLVLLKAELGFDEWLEAFDQSDQRCRDFDVQKLIENWGETCALVDEIPPYSLSRIQESIAAELERTRQQPRGGAIEETPAASTLRERNRGGRPVDPKTTEIWKVFDSLVATSSSPSNEDVVREYNRRYRCRGTVNQIDAKQVQYALSRARPQENSKS